jgi:hypothetical protein
MRRIIIDKGILYCKFENNFFCPDSWDEESKASYLSWKKSLGPNDWRANDPLPWETDQPK